MLCLFNGVLVFLLLLNCFQVCRAPSSSPGFDPERPHDEGRERTREDALAEGGCPWRGGFRENGELWNPRVGSVGASNCITCQCKVDRAIAIFVELTMTINPTGLLNLQA